ncbi:MAG: hypothetical protein ABIN89_15135 [Chitinophagaceae bacterium]
MLKVKTIGWFILILIITQVSNAQRANTVAFPVVSEPVRVTDTNRAHLFASYYGINSWSKNERYVTVLETDVTVHIPSAKDTATLGLVDLKTNKFIPIAETTAWNLQQGCMAHWLTTNPDSVIIYNDCRQGKFVSVILNVFTRKEIKVLPYPISAVSSDGKEAISINFARIRLTRPDYGYDGNGQDAKAGIAFPDDDGLFLMNLETGKTTLIVSFAQIKDQVPIIKKEGIEYIGHTLFSRGGTSVFFLARAIPDWNTTAFTVNKNGSNLQRCFPEGWGGSHFDWLNDKELMITATYNGKQYGHILFTPGEKNYMRLGNGLLDYDGHGTFSPNGKWMVTDTYPAPDTRDQKIFLMDMKTGAVLSLGRYPEPVAYTAGWRCDIHCRWSPKGDMIGFNSTHNGTRQVYILKLSGSY